MTFFSKRKQWRAAVTREEAQEIARSACEGLAKFHRCIIESYRALAKDEEQVAQAPYGAVAYIHAKEPGLSVNLLLPLREFQKRTEGGQELRDEDMKAVFAAGGDLRDCLPVADRVLVALSERMQKYRTENPAHEALALAAYNLLAHRLCNEGKPPGRNVMSAMARGLGQDAHEWRRAVDILCREELAKGSGEPRFEVIDELLGKPRAREKS